MNALDVAVGILIIIAAVGGYRIGFVARVTSWIGMALGLFAAMRALPWLLSRMRGSGPDKLVLVTLAAIFMGAMVGQAVGFALGRRIRPRGIAKTGVRLDRVAGAVAGTFGVLALLWLMIPVLAGSSGSVSALARGSLVAGALDDRLPHAPDSMQALRSFMGQENFPAVFDALRPTPDLGPPPTVTGLTSGVSDRVKRSVVKVEGVACNMIQDGTGFVVGPDLVVTNAHVVAGEAATEVELDDNPQHRVKAVVVAFDPRRDIAVLSTSGLNRSPLPVVDSSKEAKGGVFGHPGGGSLRIAPFDVGRQLRAIGRDIYGTSVTSRDVLELRSGLRPGDSGSALVNSQGQVVGVAFAIAPDKAGVAYALSTSELRAVLSGDLSRKVDTGPCTGEA